MAYLRENNHIGDYINSYIGGLSDTEAAFTPKSIANLAAWYRADLGITLNGSTVSAWADQSGNGNNVTQGTANKQPLFVASDSNVNNKPVLDFDGSNDQMQGNFAAALTGEKNWTLITVGQWDTLTGTRCIASVGAGGNGYDLIVNFSGTGKREVVHKGVAAMPDDNATTNYEIWSATRDNSGSPNVILKVNGVTQSISTPNTVMLTPGVSISIGANFTVSFMDGKVAEVIVYNNKISDADLAKLHTYLGSRYGITIS